MRRNGNGRCWFDWMMSSWGVNERQFEWHTWLLTFMGKNVKAHCDWKKRTMYGFNLKLSLFLFSVSVNSGHVCFLCSTAEWVWYYFFSAITQALLCAYFSLVNWKLHWKALDVRLDCWVQTSPHMMTSLACNVHKPHVVSPESSVALGFEQVTWTARAQ